MKRPKSFTEEQQQRYDQYVTGARKKLNKPLEEFFLIAALEFGYPSEAPFGFQRNYYESGVLAWCRYEAKGKQWASLCARHGEAELRVPYLYKQYRKWVLAGPLPEGFSRES